MYLKHDGMKPTLLLGYTGIFLTNTIPTWIFSQTIAISIGRQINNISSPFGGVVPSFSDVEVKWGYPKIIQFW